MITVSLKRSEKPEFVKNITAYLSRKYPSHVLSSHAAALAAFGELSAAFRNIQNGTGEDCKETSIRYYSELVLLENHFNFGRGPDEIQVEFVWYDSFRVKKLKKCSSYFLSLEKAGILFNIGAIQSQLATGTRDLKTQKYLFEAAAGVFAHLRDTVLPELKNLTSGPTPDITYESLSGIVFLMLANAQACYYERAWTDNKSAATLEKMACQTASYYDQALEFFSLPALAEPLEREKHPLPSMVRYYHLHYSAVAQYYKAVTIQNSNTGEAIARLQQAGNLRRQADKFAINTSTDLPSLKQALTSINNKLTELQKDNDMFIHSPIPRFESLEPLEKKSFVKALPCSEVLNTVVPGSAQDPWSRITPVALQKTVRDYGPQVEKMLAELERQAEVNSLTLRCKKTQLNLPDCLDAAMQQGSQALPDTLIEQIGGITQEVEASPYDHLSEQLSLLKDRFQEAEEELKQAELKLIQGVNAHGDMARRLQDEMYNFRHHLRKLEDMISDLQRSFDAAAGGLEKLDMTKEELKEITMSRHFPAHRTVRFPDNVALSVGKLKNYLKILDNIERHRQDLLDKAKVRTAQFLSKLQEGNPVPFPEAFKEIEQFKGELQTSFNSQKSALDALELEFAKFQASCPEYIRRCESQLAEFQKAVRDFRELQQRIGQGLTAASGVLSQVKSFGVRSAQASLANMRLKDGKTSSPRATVVGGPTVTGPSGAPSVQIQAPAPPPRRPNNQLPPPSPQVQGRPATGASYLQAPTNNKPVSTGSNPDLSRYLDGPATWEIDAENVHLGQVLGQGGFGKVYEGEWLGTRVAVKELVTRLSDQDVLADFQREVRMLSALRHPNIITFYGACERGGQVLIVTEYAEEGHLRTYLQTKKPSWDQKLIIIYNILCGMKYLVSRRPPILHRDLKSYNVLMMADGKAKLADFGLARIKSESTARISAAGTPHWMAPELLRGDAPGASEKSDVFSFAVVVWEIVSEQLPWAGMIPQAVIGQVGFNNKRLPVPTDCDQYISRLISRCWVENPDHRPSFSLILDEFKQVYPQFMPTNQRSPRPSGPMHGLFPGAGAGQGQGQQGARLDGSPGQSSSPLVSMVGDSNDHESVVVERPLDGKENCEQQ